MHCPACDADIPDRSKFCNACGEPIPRACPSCGVSNGPRAKFCNECGSKLDATVEPIKRRSSAPAIAVPEAERRQLTVMFCDLVGSTRLAGLLDPEDLREVTRAYQEAASAAIRRFDGHIAQLLGDGLLVYFGYPNAHEDDAQRAGLTGLAIITAIEALSSRLQREMGIEVAVRIGIHTGTTVVGAMGDDSHKERLAIGETPNVAARLQGLAAPNTAVISAVTARLIRGRFDWQEIGRHELAGVAEPMQVYRLLRAAASGHSRMTALSDENRLTPMIGRERDLATLRASWQQCRDGNGRVALVTGEAGIGKSRLVHAFGAEIAIEEQTWLGCRCSPFYTGTAYRPLIEMLHGLCAFGDDDSDATLLEKLENQLGGLGFELTDAIPVLAPVLGVRIPDGRYSPLTLSPQMKKQRAQERLLELLMATARDKGLVLVVEDLQWADQSSLEILGLLVERFTAEPGAVPVLALLTARPGFEAPWPVDAEIALGRLPDDQVQVMIQNITSHKKLPGQVVELLTAKADGNPLYVEELTEMLLDSGQLALRDGTYELSVALPSLEIPATIRDSLVARLDRSSQAKTITQIAATIGREFDFGLMQKVMGIDSETLEEGLGHLGDAGILVQRGMPPTATYAFRHALVQDAAYSSLLRRTRQQYHGRIAEILESDAPGTASEVLAHHYRAAGDAARAIVYWQAAGQAALRSWALAEATTHLQRGLALIDELPAGQARALDELGLRLTIGVPLMLTRGFASPEMEATTGRIFELCAEVGDAAADRLFPAFYGLWIFHHVRALYPKAAEMADRMIELAGQSSDRGIELGGLHARGCTRLWRGRVADGRADLERALEIYDARAHGHLTFLFGQDARAFCLAILIWAYWSCGDIAKARAHRADALAWCDELGQPGSQAFVELVVSVFHCLMAEYEQAEDHSRTLIALSAEQGMPHWEAYGKISLGWSQASRGQADEGAELIRTGIATALAVGSRTSLSFGRAALIETELGRGRVAAAREVFDEHMVLVEESDERFFEPELIRLGGEIELAEGRAEGRGEGLAESRERAGETFRRALEIARQRGATVMAERAEASLARLARMDGPPDG